MDNKMKVAVVMGGPSAEREVSSATGTAVVSALKEKGYDPLAFRFMCLNSHYRKQLVFSYDALEQANNTLKKLLNKIKKIRCG